MYEVVEKGKDYPVPIEQGVSMDKAMDIFIALIKKGMDAEIRKEKK